MTKTVIQNIIDDIVPLSGSMESGLSVHSITITFSYSDIIELKNKDYVRAKKEKNLHAVKLMVQNFYTKGFYDNISKLDQLSNDGKLDELREEIRRLVVQGVTEKIELKKAEDPV